MRASKARTPATKSSNGVLSPRGYNALQVVYSLGNRRGPMFQAMGLLLLVVGLTDPGMGSEDAAKKLVIHEWGTFTSLQDEDGKAVGGINTDDEPVPAFVHQLRK